MEKSWTRFPEACLGEEGSVENFVVLDRPPIGAGPGQLPLEIGLGAVIRSHSMLRAESWIGTGFQSRHVAVIRGRCRLEDDFSLAIRRTPPYPAEETLERIAEGRKARIGATARSFQVTARDGDPSGR